MEVVAAAGAAECIVVSVVVRDRTDGAGDENVLSLPLPPPPIVPIVASPDEAACEGAASECAWSCSVDIVAARDLFPIVGGGNPSTDDWTERLLRSSEEVLIDVAVGTVENERCPFGAVELPFIGRPDSGYGLLFFAPVGFFEFGFIW